MPSESILVHAASCLNTFVNMSIITTLKPAVTPTARLHNRILHCRFFIIILVAQVILWYSVDLNESTKTLCGFFFNLIFWVSSYKIRWFFSRPCSQTLLGHIQTKKKVAFITRLSKTCKSYCFEMRTSRQAYCISLLLSQWPRKVSERNILEVQVHRKEKREERKQAGMHKHVTNRKKTKEWEGFH